MVERGAEEERSLSGVLDDSSKRLMDGSHSDVNSDIYASDLDSSGHSRRGGGASVDSEEPSIAQHETKAVRKLKLLMYLVLAASAVAVALAIYFITSSTEQAQFQNAFRDSSIKVMDSIGKAIYRSCGALDAFSTHLVSHARDTNQTWPFILYPDFALRAEKLRALSAAVQFSVHPLVEPHQRKQYEAFAWANKDWINQSMKLQETDPNYYGTVNYDHQLVYTIHHDLFDIPYDENRTMAPSWYNSPVETQTRSGGINWDLLSQTKPDAILEAIASRRPVLTESYMLPDMNDPENVAEYEAWKEWFKNYVPPGDDPGAPAVDLQWPILDRELSTVMAVDNYTDDQPSNPKVVGQVMVGFFWRDMLRDILPKGSNGTVVVFHNPCNPTFTYALDGPAPVYLGRGDLHDPAYDHMAISSKLEDLDQFSSSRSKYTGPPINDKYCPYTLITYPSATIEAQYVSKNPIYFMVGALCIFAFTLSVFLLYDYMVERRQRKVMSTAKRTNAIVSQLFPSVVRDRIYATEGDAANRKAYMLTNTKTKLKTFLNDGASTNNDKSETSGKSFSAAPIAELFPDCTVMFADIVGFTAWSSMREPTQVFTLLESIYGAFDDAARKRGVFKVETIGDSYVAVCGLPETREDHALVMSRFALDCRKKMNQVTRSLESTLGPDTSDLKLRFGLNSGPVTAGVLRGERARFQLFGDTVNCAARMESNGVPSKIQCSQKTADLLIAAGKRHWLEKRPDLVEAKGKGKLQTYWIDPPSRSCSEHGGDTSHSSLSSVTDALHILGFGGARGDISAERLERLIDWNVDAFACLIKRIVARRMVNSGKHATLSHDVRMSPPCTKPRSEVCEVIMLPDFEFNTKTPREMDVPDVALSDDVHWQLREIVSILAYMYRPNSFHNFEHASHVTMSIIKLLQRVMSQDVSLDSPCKNKLEAAEQMAAKLHACTYGITSDPLTQFAIVFAALIHDVDHPGVTNTQLVKENDPMAVHYDNQSVAEQNSVAIAFEVLMRSEYAALRDCLFADHEELKRFRQLVVNSVMATDIFDPELKAMREARWSKSFQTSEDDSDIASVGFKRKATIIIEHLIQASDVSHTMQHWHIYIKWNTRLFHEMFAAYKAGRSGTNPADGWYKGELWFFDNYIIPLANKLKECRVFGVSCDEFLDYALDNRTEWEAKGQEIVARMLEEAELRYGDLEDPEVLIRRRQSGSTGDEKVSKVWTPAMDDTVPTEGPGNDLCTAVVEIPEATANEITVSDSPESGDFHLFESIEEGSLPIPVLSATSSRPDQCRESTLRGGEQSAIRFL